MKYRVKELRTDKNLTQEQLAELTGISRQSISNIETGNYKDINGSTLMSIAKALNCKTDDLFFKEEVK